MVTIPPLSVAPIGSGPIQASIGKAVRHHKPLSPLGHASHFGAFLLVARAILKRTAGLAVVRLDGRARPPTKLVAAAARHAAVRPRSPFAPARAGGGSSTERRINDAVCRAGCSDAPSTGKRRPAGAFARRSVTAALFVHGSIARTSAERRPRIGARPAATLIASSAGGTARRPAAPLRPAAVLSAIGHLKL